MQQVRGGGGAYSNYVNLLPNKDRSEKADWSRAEIRFLRSFGQRTLVRERTGHRRQGCTPSTSGW